MAIIASWNINSVRIRIDILQKFIEEINPDVILLQKSSAQMKNFQISTLHLVMN